jgi:RimJ/RimL family protein N-acetyltransferase
VGQRQWKTFSQENLSAWPGSIRMKSANPSLSGTAIQSTSDCWIATKDWLDKQINDEPETTFWFAMRALEDDRLLGDIDLTVINWGSRDAFLGIGIGERAFWGKGYGSDALQVVLRYAFLELNLRRVTLNVFEYNQRAVRTYEKARFRPEGRVRQAMQREGRRYDILYMGILREEWMEGNGNKTINENLTY